MSKKDVSVEIKIVKIDDLIQNEINPRKIKRKEYEELKKSLLEFPDMKKLREIIADETMTILAGHQRVYALKDLGYEDVEVKIVQGLTEAQKRRFIALDNDHSGEWDYDIIANVWNPDELKEWGIKSIKIPSLAGDRSDKEDVEFQADKHKDVECPNCGFHFDPKEK
jgi:ParB-like chromosome segregation protein Spo0J